MKEFIDFLFIYWKPIVGLVFFIVGFIIAVFKKKPIEDIYKYIYAYSILAVNYTEVDSTCNPDIKGDVKLARAVEYVCKMLLDTYPTLDVNKYISLIKNIIEEILCTPQKKR